MPGTHAGLQQIIYATQVDGKEITHNVLGYIPIERQFFSLSSE